MRRILACECRQAMLAVASVLAFGQTSEKVDVKKGTVVYVSGQDVVVKLDDGAVRHFVVPRISSSISTANRSGSINSSPASN
jgi:hypothetical protein